MWIIYSENWTKNSVKYKWLYEGDYICKETQKIAFWLLFMHDASKFNSNPRPLSLYKIKRDRSDW